MESDLKVRFGKLLASRRRARGMTQPELADKAGVAISTIRALEGAKSSPSFNMIEKLVSALNIDPADLFSTNFYNKDLNSRHVHDISAALSKLNEGEIIRLKKVIFTMIETK